MNARSRIVVAALWLILAGCSGAAPASGTRSMEAASSTPTLSAPTVATTVQPTPAASATPNVVTGHMKVGDLTRDYLVVTPPDVAAHDPLPLMFALHGRTQTMHDAESIGGFDAMAMDPGAVIVYPQGYQGSWNAGGCCTPATTDGVDDVAFISALIDRMEADYPVDPNRVFVVGGSNGGEMAERAACELSDRIAAIADVIGTLLVDCQPSQPVSVIAIHGADDVQIPIDGGVTDDPSCRRDAPCPAFADVMERWRQIDRCPGDPSMTEDASTSATAWTDCAGGTAVTFITAKGKGHDWYTGNPNDRTVTWEFFMNHPRAAGTG